MYNCAGTNLLYTGLKDYIKKTSTCDFVTCSNSNNNNNNNNNNKDSIEQEKLLYLIYIVNLPYGHQKYNYKKNKEQKKHYKTSPQRNKDCFISGWFLMKVFFIFLFFQPVLSHIPCVTFICSLLVSRIQSIITL